MCDHASYAYDLATTGPTIDHWQFRCTDCQLSASGATAQQAREAWENLRVRDAAIERWKRGEPPKDNTERRVLAMLVYAPSCHHKH